MEYSRVQQNTVECATQSTLGYTGVHWNTMEYSGVHCLNAHSRQRVPINIALIITLTAAAKEPISSIENSLARARARRYVGAVGRFRANENFRKRGRGMMKGRKGCVVVSRLAV